MNHSTTRRLFLQVAGLGGATLALTGNAVSQEKTIQGFEKASRRVKKVSRAAIG